jgi:hypothetical protein
VCVSSSDTLFVFHSLLKSKREDSTYLLPAEEEVEVALAGRRKMKKE